MPRPRKVSQSDVRVRWHAQVYLTASLLALGEIKTAPPAYVHHAQLPHTLLTVSPPQDQPDNEAHAKRPKQERTRQRYRQPGKNHQP